MKSKEWLNKISSKAPTIKYPFLSRAHGGYASDGIVIAHAPDLDCNPCYCSKCESNLESLPKILNDIKKVAIYEREKRVTINKQDLMNSLKGNQTWRLDFYNYTLETENLKRLIMGMQGEISMIALPPTETSWYGKYPRPVYVTDGNREGVICPLL